MALRNWVKLPTAWIQGGGLQQLRWGQNDGSSNVAALMLLALIAHHADEETGVSKLTYDSINGFTGLSRAKVSAGLQVLDQMKVIERRVDGRRSFYQLTQYGLGNAWGKLPAKRLYSNGILTAYQDFHLRRSSELHALKLYFLFVARRDNDSNLARISYDSIEQYTGIERHNIKTGLSVLAAQGLVHIEHLPSTQSNYGISNAYRLAYLDPTRHMGTTGRGFDEVDA